MKKPIYWYIGILSTISLIVAVVSDFNVMDSVQIQLHDTYVAYYPWQLSLLLFTAISFMFSLSPEFINEMNKKNAIWAGTIQTILAFPLLFFISYASYSIVSFNLMVGSFITDSETQVAWPFYKMVIISLIFILMLLGLEVFLIKRIVRHIRRIL